MGIKTHVKNLLAIGLHRYGYDVVHTSLLYDWQRFPINAPAFKRTTLPNGAESYLHDDNPQLMDLRRRYASFDRNVTTPLVWTDDTVTADDIKYFRGDNAYIWQLRGKSLNAGGYALTTYYVKAIDELGLLDKLDEDEQFGNFTFQIDGRLVSLDLLDSIIEILFLEKHLSLSTRHNLTVLDIGAGYGRLAHRMTSALPNIHSYLCTDAYAPSTFISEFYLRYRGSKARVIPLYDIEKTLAAETVELAVNIHSFSECRLEAIEWWLTLLERHHVKHLMIVPNTSDPEGSGAALTTNDGKDFQGIVETHGYKLVAKEPKYSDPTVQEYATNATYFYLFEFEH